MFLILMGANPLLGPLEGVGPENRDFLWPRECYLDLKNRVMDQNH